MLNTVLSALYLNLNTVLCNNYDVHFKNKKQGGYITFPKWQSKNQSRNVNEVLKFQHKTPGFQTIGIMIPVLHILLIT